MPVGEYPIGGVSGVYNGWGSGPGNSLGWSGVSGASTSSAGTTASDATSTAPASGTFGGASDMWASMTSGCTLCQSAGFKQAVFFFAAVLLVVSWKTHLHSVLE